MRAPLPIDEHVPRVVEALRRGRAAVLIAPPGAGKTTRVPPALVGDGAVFVLQPRRVAARSIARRIAEEQGWTVGREVGWQVRFEREFSDETTLLVATEGILAARMQSDPLLAGFRTVVLDEFHERSVHADLGLALLREALEARDELRVLVMSATLEAAPVAEFLGGATVIEVQGRPHPVEVEWAPGLRPAEAVRRVAAAESGHILCFLPGASEIRALAAELSDLSPRFDLLPLHGSLDARAQDLALAPGPRRKIVLATNLAETSVTVEGVTDVVDTGWHKVLRYDDARGLDRLEPERIPMDSAEQRAGRAGRTGPGRALRLWDRRDRLRPHREPEILRVDLAGPLLEVLAWGADPLAFRWFESPPEARVRAGLELLRLLGAITDHRLTPLGDAMRRLPLHPRLGRVLLEAGCSRRAAAACAVLAEQRGPRAPEATSTDSDVLAMADRLAEAPFPVRQAARELAERAARLIPGAAAIADDEGLRRALLLGFPDRVARRRSPRSPRLLLASGTGAALSRESGVHEGEFLLALDVVAGPADPNAEARVRVASRVERAWLAPTRRETVHRLDGEAGLVRAVEREWYLGILLSERTVTADHEEAAAILAAAIEERGFGPEAEGLLRRARFAGVDLDVGALVRQACAGRMRLADVDLVACIPSEARRAVDRLAPSTLTVPSGRRVTLRYGDDGSVLAAVKLQELFGLDETPRLGPRREPVTFELLAPSGRPVQTTRDLRSFWDKTYPEVRRELRGRYPKHPWPEDPRTAEPTHRTRRQR